MSQRVYFIYFAAETPLFEGEWKVITWKYLRASERMAQ